jgi:hypothetical protein
MSTVSGLGTTFNLPNYHGELIAITPTDTPLLSMSGGLTGGGQTRSPRFEWQTEDLRAPEIRTRLEGAAAPTAESRARGQDSNICQIFHESVETTYTKMAATEQYATAASAPFYSNGGAPNPVGDEHAHQVLNALKTIARDVNYTFWHGVKVEPTTNSTARATAGLLSVITTNRTAVGEVTGLSASTDTVTESTTALSNGDKIVFTSVGASTTLRLDTVYYVVSKSTNAFKVSLTLGGAAVTIGTATVAYIPADNTFATVDAFEAILQGIFDNGGIAEQDTATLFASSRQKRMLTALYADAYAGAVPVAGAGRTVGGVSVDTIVTNFGTLNVKIDRALPPDALAVVSLEQIRPVFLSIPGKGVLFEEELARAGSSVKSQIYGEIGLEYGNVLAHGVVRGLAV